MDWLDTLKGKQMPAGKARPGKATSRPYELPLRQLPIDFASFASTKTANATQQPLWGELGIAIWIDRSAKNFAAQQNWTIA